MKINKYFFLLIYSICFLYSFISYSKNQPTNVENQLIVEADESLEWFEKQKYYMAKGNVTLIKNGLKLNADTVQAKYIEEKGENVLKMIIAKGNVILTKGKIRASGELMTYNVEKKIVSMSGGFQNFSSPSGYIESNKSIMFNDINNQAEAVGKVKIILINETIIFADNVIANFTGKTKSLKKAIAKGNVIIENSNNKKKSKADFGIYDPIKGIIKLKGNVIIINEGSKITGSQGTTNIKTGMSKIIGNTKGRVKGVFSPNKKRIKGGKAE